MFGFRQVSDYSLGLLLFYFFLMLAFLLPNHYLPWMSFYSEALVFFGLGLFFLFCNRDKLFVGFWFSLVGILFLVVCAQLALGMFAWVERFWIAAAYLLAAAMAAALGRQSGVVELGAWVFLLAGIVSAGIAIGQWFDVWESVYFLVSGAGQRATANLAQSNHLATLLLMAIASAFWLRATNYLGRYVFLLAVVFLSVAVVVTGSRMAWLQFFLLGGLWFFAREYRAWDLFSFCVSGVVIFLGAACVSSLSVLLLLVEDYPSTGAFDRFADTSRWQLWKGLLVQAWDKGGFGYGIGQVANAQVDAGLSLSKQLFALHSHNLLIDFLLWFGPWVGSFFLLLAFFWVFKRFCGMGRCSRDLYVFVVLGVMGVHALLEYPHEYAYFLIPGFLYLGALDRGQGVLRRPLYGLLFLFSVLLFSIFCRDYYHFEREFRELRYEMARLGVSGYTATDVEFYLLDGAGLYIKYMRGELPGDISEKILLAKELTYAYPYVPSFYRCVLLLVEAGFYREAHDMLLRLKSLHGSRAYEGVLESMRESDLPGIGEFFAVLSEGDQF